MQPSAAAPPSRAAASAAATTDIAKRVAQSKALWDAIGSHRPAEVLRLLDEKAGPNFKMQGLSPLQRAILHTQLEMVGPLIAAGAQAGPGEELCASVIAGTFAAPRTAAERDSVRAAVATDSGKHALLFAVCCGHDDACTELLALGADVCVEGARLAGYTVLDAAAEFGHAEALRRCSEGLARVIGDGGPLIEALNRGFDDVAAVMIDAGLLKRDFDDAEIGPLALAARKGRIALVQRMLDAGASPDGAEHAVGETPLEAAVDNGHIDIARLLLERGADANRIGVAGDSVDPACNAAYTTPLGIAASDEVRGPALIELLLAHGARVNDGGPDGGWTPIANAAQSAAPANIVALLAAGATLQTPDVEPPAICLAVSGYAGSLESVQLLLDAGADANAVDEDGRPALVVAAQESTEDVALLLLQHKADPQGLPGMPSPLWWACYKGRDGLVAALLEAKASALEGQIEITSGIGVVAAAVRAGCSIKTLRALLDAGADPDAGTDGGRTALAQAALSKRGAAVMALLLERGADVNAVDSQGKTALAYVVGQADEYDAASLRLLLDAKAALSWPCGGSKATALVAAIDANNLGAVRALLDAGADVSERGADDMSTLELACALARVDIVELILKRIADVKPALLRFNERRGVMLSSALISCTRQRAPKDLAVAAMLLTRMPALANTQISAGVTPLRAAARAGNLAMITLLLQHGADVNARPPDGITPLYAACRAVELDVVRALLVAGADPNAGEEIPTAMALRGKRQNPAGTPLVLAAADANTGIVTALLDAGADINARDVFGNTPLCACLFAEAAGYAATARVLLERGADPNLHGAPPASAVPLSLALMARNRALCELMLARGASVGPITTTLGVFTRVTTPLHVAAFTGNSDAVQAILAAKADLTARDSDGRLPLHRAAEYSPEAERVVRLLAMRSTRAGIDIDARTYQGATALHTAAYLGHPKSIAALVEQGADVNARCKKGNTPLMDAALNGHLAAAQALLERKADVLARNKTGHTAMLIAAASKHDDIAKALIAASGLLVFEQGGAFSGRALADAAGGAGAGGKNKKKK